jgi:hypothetical protein
LFIRKEDYNELQNILLKHVEQANNDVRIISKLQSERDKEINKNKEYQKYIAQLQSERDKLKNQKAYPVNTEKKVKFFTYYAERLEWWKKKFDKKPEPHKLRIDYEGDYEFVIKDNMEDIEKTLLEFTEAKDFIEIMDCETGQEIYVPVNKVSSYTVIPGHPNKYSDSEIEQWAKEQLDKEVQNWRVVKENDGIKIPYDNHLTHIQKITELQNWYNKQLNQRNGISTNISGD